MRIFHGDDYPASRQALNRYLDQLSAQGLNLTRFERDQLDLTAITQALESTNLFGASTALIIFNLFAGPSSAKKKKIQAFLAEHQNQEIVLYEDKTLTASQLKLFPQTEVALFKPKAAIFTLLDSLAPGDNRQALTLLRQLLDQGEPAGLIFALLVRQFRLLIQATSPESLKLPSWLKGKLTAQAQKFGPDKLLTVHRRLYQLDKNLKTGQNPLDLSTQIFSLLANL